MYIISDKKQLRFKINNVNTILVPASSTGIFIKSPVTEFPENMCHYTYFLEINYHVVQFQNNYYV